MKRVFYYLIALACLAAPVLSSADTLVYGRSGFRNDKVGTFKFAEVLQTSGRWVPLDVGYIDFGNCRDYREVFAGVGMNVVDTKGSGADGLIVCGELCLDRAAGYSAGRALYLQPFTQTNLWYRRFAFEIVYIPYVPVNTAAVWQHVLERAKLEYSFGKCFSAGGGYAMYHAEGGSWDHKPFVLTVVKTKFGDLENWVQRLPGNKVQVQFRYLKAFLSK